MRLFPALSDRCPIAQSNNASAVLSSTDCLFGLLERAWRDAKAGRSAGGAPGGFAHVASFVSILDDGHPGATQAWLRFSGRHKSARASRERELRLSLLLSADARPRSGCCGVAVVKCACDGGSSQQIELFFLSSSTTDVSSRSAFVGQQASPGGPRRIRGAVGQVRALHSYRDICRSLFWPDCITSTSFFPKTYATPDDVVYPAIIKLYPVFGSGGRGVRVAYRRSSLDALLNSTAARVAAASGEPRPLLQEAVMSRMEYLLHFSAHRGALLRVFVVHVYNISGQAEQPESYIQPEELPNWWAILRFVRWLTDATQLDGLAFLQARARASCRSRIFSAG